MKLLILALFTLYSGLVFGQGKTLRTVSVPIGTEKRVALLIGNKDYLHLRSLSNSYRDVDSMEVVLRKLGFDVVKTKGLNYRETIAEVNKFGKNIRTADVALFYYSGHGAGYDRQTFLLPPETEIGCLEEVETQGISLERILKNMELSPSLRNAFVFMDNCRDISEKLRPCSVKSKNGYIPKGWILPKTNPRGRMVVFATQEGYTADDDTYDKYNSLFTAELIKYLPIPNLGIRDIIDKVAVGMETRSNMKQYPDKLENLRGNFVFIQDQQRNNVKSGEVAPVINVAAIAQRGIDLYDKNELDTALPLLSQAAELGHAQAQYYLGLFHDSGGSLTHSPEAGRTIIQPRYSEAIKWFRKSADQENSMAQHVMGLYYHNGNGVEKDIYQALAWFTRSANNRYSYGQYNLGLCYEFGRGVKVNLAEAKKWYQKAADQGVEIAADRIKSLDEVPQWREKSSGKGRDPDGKTSGKQ